MEINVGIIGYGNLGKALEFELLKCKNIKLVSIFSRRNNLKSRYNTNIDSYDNITNYKNDIDIMLICLGSCLNLCNEVKNVLHNFNTIDCYDNHSNIINYKQELKKISNVSNKVAIISCGWDPGFLSVIRTYNNIFLDKAQVLTFWGKGVSQGHTNAIKGIDGVVDAISYTIPSSDIIKQARKGKVEIKDEKHLHKRECYVAIDNKHKKEEIKDKILHIKDYFMGYQVDFHFVNKEVIDKLKKRMFHKGQIIANSDKNKQQTRFYLKIDSNPNFTAKIMIAYIRAIKKLKAGVYTVLDIPPKYLLEDYEKLI